MISTKGRYALKVMVELAEHDAEEYIPLKGIAEKLNISQKYLESISTILSKGHMIEGVSGKKGGYRLNRKPEEYRVGDILRLTEGTLAPVSCLREDQEPCEKSDSCCTLPIWKGLADLIDKYFDEMTLADVLQSKQEAEKKALKEKWCCTCEYYIPVDPNLPGFVVAYPECEKGRNPMQSCEEYRRKGYAIRNSLWADRIRERFMRKE